MQQALQYGQNGDFIRLWQVGHFVAFRVGMGPEPLCAVRIVVNEKAELLVREVALSDHRFENLLNHFCMNALMLRGM
ncbi:hypothetical protein [Symbiopectobacterium purcellii]|uniref:hypothetical protein n=1 Tax=Symbiopectobacterium purcellii TaxID=2871826 RepID=UPI003F86D2D9